MTLRAKYSLVVLFSLHPVPKLFYASSIQYGNQTKAPRLFVNQHASAAFESVGWTGRWEKSCAHHILHDVHICKISTVWKICSTCHSSVGREHPKVWSVVCNTSPLAVLCFSFHSDQWMVSCISFQHSAATRDPPRPRALVEADCKGLESRPRSGSALNCEVYRC